MHDTKECDYRACTGSVNTPSYTRARTMTRVAFTFFVEHKLIAIYSIILMFAAVSTDGFFSIVNVWGITRLASILGLLTLGEVLVILTGGIDLSVGNIASLSTMLAAAIMQECGQKMDSGLVIAVAVLACLAAGAVLGALSGLAVTRLSVPPFVATMCVMLIAQGFSHYVLRAVPTKLAISSFQVVGRGTVWLIPVPLVILLSMCLICHYGLTRFPFGRYIYAVGGNEHAAYLSGISIHQIKMVVYILSGLFAASGGLVLAAWSGTGFPRAAQGYELTSIAGAVIGGVSLLGGKGSLWDAMLGILMLATITKLVAYHNVSPFIEQMLVGAILLVAVVFSESRKHGA